jgi:hypothetical protein
MSKKSAAARRAAQRQKSKKQKSIELVRQTAQTLEEKDIEPEGSPETMASPDIEDSIEEVQDEEETTKVASPPAKESTVARETKTRRAASASLKESTSAREEKATSGAGSRSKGNSVVSEERSKAVASTAPKGSAAGRLAARRQTSQKSQQRTAAPLITAEHYSYVRKDLVIIAVLALIMFSIIIILHFVPAIGG